MVGKGGGAYVFQALLFEDGVEEPNDSIVVRHCLVLPEGRHFEGFQCVSERIEYCSKGAGQRLSEMENGF